MFVPNTKNKIKTVIATLGIVLFSSMPIGSLLRAPATFDVAYASPVTSEKLIELTNQARADNGLSILFENSLLAESAQGKSNDMLEKNYFAHTSPEGLTPWYWFKEVGYNYIYAGENLAKNFATAEGMFDAWMVSPTHRANILSENYKEIGIAIASNSDVLYATQHFGSRSNSTAGVTTITPTPVQSKPAPAIQLTPDTTAPQIAETRLPTQTLKQGGTIDFSLLVRGDPVAVTVTVGHKRLSLEPSDGRWNGQLNLFAGGTYDVMVEATDAAGNRAVSKPGAVTVEIPNIVRETPDTKTLVAAYWKDVAVNEGAPIAAALVFILIAAGGFSFYTLEARRLGVRLTTLMMPALKT